MHNKGDKNEIAIFVIPACRESFLWDIEHGIEKKDSGPSKRTAGKQDRMTE